MLFPQLSGKCQGKTCKNGAWPALLKTSFYMLFLCYLCRSVYRFVCKRVLCYCHRVKTQLQLTNISIYLSTIHKHCPT